MKVSSHISKLMMIIVLVMPVQALYADEIRDTLGFGKSVSPSPVTLLEGRVPGVRVISASGDVNAEFSTLIRGVNSFRSDNQPLWIIDDAILGSTTTWTGDSFSEYGENSKLNPINNMAFINPYDIESIEVIKDQTATALYGPKGANGVIIIKTRKGTKEGTSVNANANIGGTTGGLLHNYNLAVSSVKGHSALDISAFYRNTKGAIKDYQSNYGGIRLSYETKTNEVVWFGMNTILSMGGVSQPSSTVYFGKPSMTMAIKAPGRFPILDSRDQWMKDYDDDSREYRVVNSVYLTLNFTKNLSLKTNLGVDYKNLMRYIWYGNGTSFGYEYNGAASIASTSMLRCNASSILSWHHWIGDNRLKFSGGVDLSTDMDKFNTMDGVDFLTHELRAKGLNLHGDKAKIKQNYYSFFTVGLVANGSYSYKNYVGADFVFRADWTPRYADAEAQLYGSASLWVSPVKGLKISGGYGESGYEHYLPYTDVDTSVQMFYEGLGRLRSKEWNVAANYSTFNGRLDLHAGYFSRRTDDIYDAFSFGKQGSTYLWYWTNREKVLEYNSTLARAGVELEISGDILKTDDYCWNVWGTFTYSPSSLISVAEQDALCQSAGSGLYPQVNVYGYPAGSFVGYQTLEDGSLKDLTQDGKITEADMTILGNPDPRFYGAFGTTFKYKGFTFDLVADYAADYKVADLGRLWFYEGTLGKLTDKYLRKADHVGIRRISASYDFWKMRVGVSGFKSYGGDAAIEYGSIPSTWGCVANIMFKF